MASEANNNANVTTGKPKTGGAIFRAPVGSTLPTDATTALDAAFENLGYISEDGLSENLSLDTDIVKDWGGETIYVLDNGEENTYGFKLLEMLKSTVQKAVNGDGNVSGDLTEGMTVKINGEDKGTAAYVIEMIFNGNVLCRTVIPEAKITEIGEISYVKNELAGYDVTLTAITDSEGNLAYKYYKKKTA